MQPVYNRYDVVSNEKISPNIYKLVVAGQFEVLPGQFYNLKAWDREPLLPRPISIYDVDENSISFLYEVRGNGTRLLSKLGHNDKIELLGPLGNGFDIAKLKGRIAMVTGGIGIAPMLLVSKLAENCEVDLYAGFRNKSYSIDEFRQYVNMVSIATDTGNEGHKGFVTDMINLSDYDAVLTCGPEVMMKKIAKMAMETNVPAYVSMENHMACGIGACLVCTCKTVDGMKRTCKDGPVFRGEDLV